MVGGSPDALMKQICYRCGEPAKAEYMGLPYCRIDFHVVIAMIAALKHDPPPGFPGAGPGILDWEERTLALYSEGERDAKPTELHPKVDWSSQDSG